MDHLNHFPILKQFKEIIEKLLEGDSISTINTRKNTLNKYLNKCNKFESIVLDLK